MAVHPQVQVVLDLIEQAGSPEYWTLSPPQARAMHNEKAPILDAPRCEVHQVEDRTATTAAGPVPVRIYWPRAAAAPLPAVLWLHGGGHVIGSLDSYDSICRRLALGADAVVVSVDYRLAPEHKFPAAVDDAYGALEWLAANAAALGADGARLAVAGDSAGGNLAAVCALAARDAGLTLRAQALVYPATAPDIETASHHANAEGYILTRRLVQWFQDHYRNDETDRQNWRYAPLIAGDHARLAPALVQVAEFDPLRDEGIAYAQALMDAGNDVRLTHYAGMVHAFFSLAGAIEAARTAMDEVTAFLSARLQPVPAPATDTPSNS